jgi:hypothetical protein
MNRKDTVVVSKEMIAAASRRNSSHCMIAEAIKQTWPDIKFVSVDMQTIRFSDPERGERLFYLTPRKAQLALINFDQGNVVEDFSFVLRAPHISRMHKRVRPLPEETFKEKRAPKETRRIVKTNGLSITKTIGPNMPSYRVGRRRMFGIKSIEP